MPTLEPWIRDLEKIDGADLSAFVDTLTEPESRAVLDVLFDWDATFARPEQVEPAGAWRVWLILAGRGWGKTRSGAELVIKRIRDGQATRIALVGRTPADVRDVMIEGESGILACSPPWDLPRYQPSLRRLTWFDPRGNVKAVATGYSAAEPGALRGPQHDFAWADELCAWKLKEAWDNLILGLRLGLDPRVVVTTTPKPTHLIKDLVARPTTVVTGGSTFDNMPNLADSFIEDVVDRYEGTTLGEQELHAKLLDEAEGALWKRSWIDEHRWSPQKQRAWAAGREDEDPNALHPELDALVVAIDPAAKSTERSSETGIVAAGRCMMPTGRNRKSVSHFFVLEDGSGRYTPAAWAEKSIRIFNDYEADRIIGEQNNGGEMVEATVETAADNLDQKIPYEEVWASRGKRTRAEPISGLYQQGRVHHVGIFRDLEDQLCTWEPDEGHPSPDRLDADVWAISYLIPDRERKLTTGLDLSGGVELTRRSTFRGG